MSSPAPLISSQIHIHTHQNLNYIFTRKHPCCCCCGCMYGEKEKLFCWQQYEFMFHTGYEKVSFFVKRKATQQQREEGNMGKLKCVWQPCYPQIHFICSQCHLLYNTHSLSVCWWQVSCRKYFMIVYLNKTMVWEGGGENFILIVTYISSDRSYLILNFYFAHDEISVIFINFILEIYEISFYFFKLNQLNEHSYVLIRK